jgi:hypothetical protein
VGATSHIWTGTWQTFQARRPNFLTPGLSRRPAREYCTTSCGAYHHLKGRSLASSSDQVLEPKTA